MVLCVIRKRFLPWHRLRDSDREKESVIFTVGNDDENDMSVKWSMQFILERRMVYTVVEYRNTY